MRNGGSWLPGLVWRPNGQADYGIDDDDDDDHPFTYNQTLKLNGFLSELKSM